MQLKLYSFSLAFNNGIHVLFFTSSTIVLLSNPLEITDINWTVQLTLEKEQMYYGCSTFARYLLHYYKRTCIFVDHVQKFNDYVQVKTLMQLQKSVWVGMRN